MHVIPLFANRSLKKGIIPLPLGERQWETTQSFLNMGFLLRSLGGSPFKPSWWPLWPVFEVLHEGTLSGVR